MHDYQLIVIGAGPGGYMAALRAAELGLRTAVIESREVGGTCLHRGCIPTKTILHASQVYRDALEGARIGIHADGVRADLPAIFERKKNVSQKLSEGIESLFKRAGVDLLRGRASIAEPGVVRVTDCESAENVYTADQILVATGSAPARPPIPGLDLPGVMTSDEFLEGADTQYRSVVIIGGGVIGVEFATFFRNIGSEVTIVEGLDRLLPTMDRELGQSLASALKKQGVRIFTGAMVQNVVRSPEGLTVHFQAKGALGAETGEAVLCAVGRRPYLDGLFSGTLHPETRGGLIGVDSTYQTSIPGIYAVGDVASQIQLAHVASAQGIACVEMMCGRKSTVDMRVVPSCIYCSPEISTVGMTEAEARAAGIPVKVGKHVLFDNARTLIADTGRAFIKLVARADTHELIGAQLMCENSTDIISQISQAIVNHMTAEQLLRAIRPHPTFEEAMTQALEQVADKKK